MTITELEQEIEGLVLIGGKNTVLVSELDGDELRVVKYMPAEYLADTLAFGKLYAAERAGFTWGDAIYVAPAGFPLCTMMYGEVGVVGTYSVLAARCYDASNPKGIRLYQDWITFQTTLYRELTTTVHANAANRELRNAFRTRFQIDCVLFRPDEHCPGYVHSTHDWWLAISHWDTQRCVAHGFSGAVANLKWCVVVPDAFKPDGRGYRALLYKVLPSSHSYVGGHYSTLAADIKGAYSRGQSQVVICDFD
jgi:hypothetical protein